MSSSHGRFVHLGNMRSAGLRVIMLIRARVLHNEIFFASTIACLMLTSKYNPFVSFNRAKISPYCPF